MLAVSAKSSPRDALRQSAALRNTLRSERIADFRLVRAREVLPGNCPKPQAGKDVNTTVVDKVVELSITDHYFCLYGQIEHLEVKTYYPRLERYRTTNETVVRNLKIAYRPPDSGSMLTISIEDLKYEIFCFLYAGISEVRSEADLPKVVKERASHFGLKYSIDFADSWMSEVLSGEYCYRPSIDRERVARYSLRSDLGAIVDQIREHGLEHYRKTDTRLNIREAEWVCERLAGSADFSGIRATDIPRTYAVWDAYAPDGESYLRKGIREMLEVLARQKGERVDPRTPEGFKIILGCFGDGFDSGKASINKFGSTMQGAFRHRGRPNYHLAIIDLINNDPSFGRIREIGVAPFDFPKSIDHTWKEPTGEPSDYARLATKALIKVLGTQHSVNPTTPDGFAVVWPFITQSCFQTQPINYWGTTLASCLCTAYKNCPSLAVKDLLEHDLDFEDVWASKPDLSLHTKRPERLKVG